MNVIRWILGIIALTPTLFTTPSFACTVPPSEYFTSYNKLVKNTDNIYLASPIDVGENGKIIFKIKSVLKGENREHISSNFGFLTSSKKQTDADKNQHTFDNHTNLSFWKSGNGRSFVTPSCGINRHFVKNSLYLIFSDSAHKKAAEEIVSLEDKWLKTVKKLIKNEANDDLLKVDPMDWINGLEFALSGEITSCTGLEFKVTKQLVGKKPKFNHFSRDKKLKVKDCIEGMPFLMVKERDFVPRIERRFDALYRLKNDILSMDDVAQHYEVTFTDNSLNLNALKDVRDK